MLRSSRQHGAKSNRRTIKAGQVMLEFTFCMIVILLMLYGIVKVFHWAGADLVERQKSHENVLINGATPLEQISPEFYAPVSMNAIWDGN